MSLHYTQRPVITQNYIPISLVQPLEELHGPSQFHRPHLQYLNILQVKVLTNTLKPCVSPAALIFTSAGSWKTYQAHVNQ